MLLEFDPGAGYQFIEKASWIPTFNINYYLGVDGLSVPLVFLTVFALSNMYFGFMEYSGPD